MIDYPIERQLEFVCLERDALEARVAALTNSTENWKQEALRATEVATKYMDQVAALTAAREQAKEALLHARVRLSPSSPEWAKCTAAYHALDAAGGAS